MSAASSDDKATLPEPSHAALNVGAGTCLAVTIALSSDLARTGERAVLGAFVPGLEARIGRNEPLFAPLCGVGSPLGDAHVSRTPIVLRVLEGGRVEVDRAGTATSVVIKGRAITKEIFSAEDVGRGIALLLASNVVLLVHRLAADPRPVRRETFGLLGQSDSIVATLTEVYAVSDLTKPVLLRGESGSGKELVARAIHKAGPRKDAPFVAVNLGAVPETIAAAELFGSERGAFTGATRRRGYFEQAEGGTLFLDEIGEAPLSLQAALLRALQENEIQPVGGERSRKVNVRVVAATDASLEAKIADGSFRAPLLNRLSAYQIWIPALRERPDDIARLLIHFFREELREIGEEKKLHLTPNEAPWLPAPLIAELLEYDWPGNVRQLCNVVRHLVIGSRSLEQVTMTSAAERLLTGTPENPSKQAIFVQAPPPVVAPVKRRKAGDIDREEIVRALQNAQFELAKAAKDLGIPRPSLHLAMQRLGIRTTTDLSVDEITQAFFAHGGDIAKSAATLCVSERGLHRRVRELGLLKNDG